MSDEFHSSNQDPRPESESPESQPYKPFNQYDAPPQEGAPYQQPSNPYQQPPANPYQQPSNPYQPPVNPYQQQGQPYQPPYQQPAPYQPYPLYPTPAKGLGIFAFVCSLLSVLCCGYIPPLPFIGLITAIVARVKGNRSGLTVAAIILGSIGLLITLWIGLSIILVGSNSAFYNDFIEEIIREYYYY